MRAKNIQDLRGQRYSMCPIQREVYGETHYLKEHGKSKISNCTENQDILRGGAWLSRTVQFWQRYRSFFALSAHELIIWRSIHNLETFPTTWYSGKSIITDKFSARFSQDCCKLNCRAQFCIICRVFTGYKYMLNCWQQCHFPFLS